MATTFACVGNDASGTTALGAQIDLEMKRAGARFAAHHSRLLKVQQELNAQTRLLLSTKCNTIVTDCCPEEAIPDALVDVATRPQTNEEVIVLSELIFDVSTSLIQVGDIVRHIESFSFWRSKLNIAASASVAEY